MPASIGELIEQTCPLWGVEGEVVVDGPIVRIRTGERTVTVRRSEPEDELFRWYVSSRAPGEAAGRDRPCTSVLGVLNAVRAALGADVSAARRLRIGAGEAAP